MRTMQGDACKPLSDRHNTASQPSLSASRQQSLLQAWSLREPASSSAPACTSSGEKSEAEEVVTSRKRKLPDSLTAAANVQEQAPSSSLPPLDLRKVLFPCLVESIAFQIKWTS